MQFGQDLVKEARSQREHIDECSLALIRPCPQIDNSNGAALDVYRILRQLLKPDLELRRVNDTVQGIAKIIHLGQAMCGPMPNGSLSVNLVRTALLSRMRRT